MYVGHRFDPDTPIEETVGRCIYTISRIHLDIVRCMPSTMLCKLGGFDTLACLHAMPGNVCISAEIVYIDCTQCYIAVSAMQSTYRQFVAPGFYFSRTQTTPSTTNSHLSYQCKITTTSSTEKKNARCSQCSRYVSAYAPLTLALIIVP